MTEIMQSIQPKWCELIASGKKTIEVRKTRPKIEPPFKAYIYCTKFIDNGCDITTVDLTQKVIGEYICDEVIGYPYIDDYGYIPYHNIDESELAKICLTKSEFENYGDDKTLYGWHISDLIIYDTPKDIREFYHPCPYTEKPCSLCKYADWESEHLDCQKALKRPPQSWCYVM